VFETVKEYLSVPGSCAEAIRRQLLQSKNLQVSATTIRRWIKQAGFSRKRLSTKILGHVTHEQIQDYRGRFHDVVRPDTLIVSLDECYFSEKVLPLYGYSRVGHRCILRNKTGGSWTKQTLILAISSEGDFHHQITKGSVNREGFGEFILGMPYPPDTVIIMDNCSIHKKLSDVFEAKGYVPLFLSPYSPMFQPVELAFSKAKGLFRSKWPWTDGVSDAIHHENDVKGFFRHAQKALHNSSQ